MNSYYDFSMPWLDLTIIYLASDKPFTIVHLDTSSDSSSYVRFISLIFWSNVRSRSESPKSKSVTGLSVNGLAITTHELSCKI